jgi:hypothetical protein
MMENSTLAHNENCTVIRNSGNDPRKAGEKSALTERKKNDRKVRRDTSLCLLLDICMRQQKANKGARNCRTRLKFSTALFHFILLSPNNKNNYPIKQTLYSVEILLQSMTQHALNQQN